MAPVLTMINLPAAGIGILLAVDKIPDMFRSTANVTGWLCVVSILSRDAAATSNTEAQSAEGRERSTGPKTG
jgi:Na+/H+-dicarboxylate symporter